MYKITVKYFLCFLLLGLFAACDKDDSLFEQMKDANQQVKTGYSSAPLVIDNKIKGVINVKLTRELAENIAIQNKGEAVQCAVSPFNVFLNGIQAKKMTRLFPYAGKYEERTRREGLDLWYTIEFNEDVLVNEAMANAKGLQGVEVVEELYPIVLPSYSVRDINTLPNDNDEEFQEPFNDPNLEYQWHYNNRGLFGAAVAGADVNLYKAWEVETGKPNVLVAVVDGGIDVAHEDLNPNMHINMAEKNGQAGVDDDNNGYVDDVYGYNFVQNKGEIEYHNHGTHVAGTVAAKNNNNIGVGGVAGGNGDANSGIRMISCQIFHPTLGGGGKGHLAIKYGADNGAVISQNSWGYPYPGPGYMPQSVSDAIDYFIKYAGCDNNGNQLANSPMKGGIVIFAAGNDDKDFKSYPAMYEKVVAVSAMAPDYTKAFYSNYGNYVDIMAPGGDDRFPRGQVLSTLPGNKYGYMQGTSMACPHVSGIAALVVSKFGGKGFTPDQVRKRLLTGLRPVNINLMNPEHAGKLGVGYIDAYRALSENKNKKPGNPKFISVTPDFITFACKWTAVEDEDDETPDVYRLYYSKTALDKSNYTNADFVDVSAAGYKKGDEIAYLLKGLELNTQYYLALEAIDRWGLKSEVVFDGAKTKENLAPVITRENDDNIKVSPENEYVLKVSVKDPEGQKWDYKVEGHNKGVIVIRKENDIFFKFNAVDPMGKFNIKLVVSDIYNTKAELDIPFEFYKNEAPKLVKEFKKFYAPLNKVKTIDLSKYFVDKEGQKITYTLKVGNEKVVDAAVAGNTLTINAKGIGYTMIRITATDIEGASVKSNIKLQVVNDDIVYIAYPVPVKRNLNVRLSDEVTNVKLSIRTLTGNTVLSRSYVVTEGNRLVTLNMENISGGTYVLYAEANGKTYKQTFIKY